MFSIFLFIVAGLAGLYFIIEIIELVISVILGFLVDIK